jgi:hypothetical protein
LRSRDAIEACVPSSPSISRTGPAIPPERMARASQAIAGLPEARNSPLAQRSFALVVLAPRRTANARAYTMPGDL